MEEQATTNQREQTQSGAEEQKQSQTQTTPRELDSFLQEAAHTLRRWTQDVSIMQARISAVVTLINGTRIGVLERSELPDQSQEEKMQAEVAKRFADALQNQITFGGMYRLDEILDEAGIRKQLDFAKAARADMAERMNEAMERMAAMREGQPEPAVTPALDNEEDL